MTIGNEFWSPNHTGKKPFGKPWCIWKDNITRKIKFRKTGMDLRPALHWTTVAAAATCDNNDVKAEISQLTG